MQSLADVFALPCRADLIIRTQMSRTLPHSLIMGRQAQYITKTPYLLVRTWLPGLSDDDKYEQRKCRKGIYIQGRRNKWKPTLS